MSVPKKDHSGDPSPADVHVGARVRLRRQLLGVSQDNLQKYERGANRIGASRMFQIAQALNVPVAYFFEGLQVDSAEKAGTQEDDAILNFLSSREGIALASAWLRVEDPSVRSALLDLVRSVSGTGADR